MKAQPVDHKTDNHRITADLFEQGSYAIILFFGGHKVLDGEMTFGVLVAFQGLMMQFLNPIQQMLSQFADIQEAKATLIESIAFFQKNRRYGRRGQCGRFGQRGRTGREQDRPITFPLLELKDITFGYQKLKPPCFENSSILRLAQANGRPSWGPPFRQIHGYPIVVTTLSTMVWKYKRRHSHQRNRAQRISQGSPSLTKKSCCSADQLRKTCRYGTAPYLSSNLPKHVK